MSEELEPAARAFERLLGALPPPTQKTGSRSGKGFREQAERSRRFRALPPQLQEGLLRYGEQIQKAYLTKFR